MGWGTLGWHRHDGPNSLCAWSRMQLGWAEVETTTRSRQEIRLGDVSVKGQLCLVPLPSGEYFLLENRQREHSYYDRHVPSPGVLIWHYNPAPMRQPLTLKCADGKWADAGYPQGQVPDAEHGGSNLDFWAHDAAYADAHAGNLGDSTDAFDGERFDSFTPQTNPSSWGEDRQWSASVDSIRISPDGVATAIV
ncbi:hypothetical protein ACFL6X_00310, partial [Candidatus Latescibacterota bacterium]